MSLIINDEYFDMMGYAEFYCKQDVRILDQGYSKFHQMFLDNSDLINININNFTAIPSSQTITSCRMYTFPTEYSSFPEYSKIS